jgi:putative toxin-antitoxin system antitoxin component (TIGR02293 family)
MFLSSVTQLLGGKKMLGREIRTQVDLIDLSRRGVPKASLLHLAEYMGSPVSQIAVLLPTTERTIQRYSPHQHFNQAVSESILQIAEVVARGTEVFGDKERFLAWLKQSSTPLGGRSPESLIASRFGAGMVLDELTRIEHGIVT